jgi:hypothetical protein
VRFELAIESAVAGAGTEQYRPSFRTSLGWDVVLDEACIAIGPIYLNENATSAAVSPWPRRIYDWAIPTALAHPGGDHFNGGEVRGEWLDQVAIDLSAGGRTTLGGHDGVAGAIGSISLFVHPGARVGAATCLRGHQAYVVGVASRGGFAMPFEGGLDIEATGNRRRLQVVADFLLDDARRVVVVVDPRPWLDQVQFEALPPDPSTGRVRITPEGQAAGAWMLGLQSSRGFAVRLE